MDSVRTLEDVQVQLSNDPASSSSASASPPVDPMSLHVVDDGGVFSTTPAAITSLVLASLDSPRSPYTLVSIMGCQSTGKSTLLNLLFGCSFRVMDATRGRAQTTKGIWLNSCKQQNSNMLVMDLEGTDSGERGEDRTTFERQTSLFALALAEVLIVNMWEHDIGRYTASNYGILKTILEVNLQLFQQHNKTILLFLIRDHIEEDTPMASLQIKLLHEVHQIWSEIRKPEKFADSQIDEFFTFKFYALPHMKLQKAKFDAGIEELRQCFLNAEHPQYYFREPLNKSVPSDGIGKYFSQIWDTVRENKELNLPGQKQMLAAYRCDEVATQVWTQFQSRLEIIRKHAEEALYADFSRQCTLALEEGMELYEHDTQYYEQAIVAEKKEALHSRLAEALHELFGLQVHFLMDEEFQNFTSTFQSDILSQSSAMHMIKGFAEKADALLHSSVESVSAGCIDLQVAGIKWNVESYIQDYEQRLRSHVEHKRAVQLDGVPPLLVQLIQQLTAESASDLLQEAPTELWEKLLQLYQDTFDIISTDRLEPILTDYACTSTERSKYLACLSTQLVTFFHTQCASHARLIGTFMRARFDKAFRYENGRLKHWQISENIQARFDVCRLDALAMLDLFKVFRLRALINRAQNGGDKEEKKEDGDSSSSLPVDPADELIDAVSVAERKAAFQYEIESVLREAEAQQARDAEHTKMPMWAIFMMVFLGWDEILSLLRNPLLLMLVLIIGGGAYLAHTLGILWPLLAMVKQTIVDTIQQQARRQPWLQALVANFGEPAPAPPNANPPAAAAPPPTSAQQAAPQLRQRSSAKDGADKKSKKAQ